jgi:error-prone DNA polymerase
MGFYPPSTLIHDARRLGVEVRPPCLKEGDWECTVEGAALRIGWRHVRGVGGQLLERLRAARAAGPFESIADAVRRAGLTRHEATALARAGTFGAWEPDRRRAAWEALRAAADDLPLAPVAPVEHRPRPLGRDELIYLDYHTVGMSLHGHPMQRVRARLRRAGAVTSAELRERRHGEEVLVGGLVTIRQRPVTANGTIFILLEDEHGVVNVVVPSGLVEENREAVKFAPFLLVRGRVERDGAVLNVVGRKFRELAVRHRLTHVSRDFR